MERIETPWGWYEEVFSETAQYKVKRIYLNPNARFSLQLHNHRNEYWTVVQGDGIVTVGETSKTVQTGDFIFVPKAIQHRLKGGPAGITIIEVQRGDFCLEEDIERFEDDYGRV
jgi:mannose-6-phosphate isomerase-like protein (cupin superfamily)